MPSVSQSNVVSADKRSTSGHSVDLSGYSLTQARFILAVTAASGTSPTLDVRIEGKTRAGNYVPLASFPQTSDATSRSITVDLLSNPFRISWTIAGTAASFTFEIDGVLLSA